MQIEKLLLIIAIDIIHKLVTTIYILIAPKFLSDLNVTQCCNKMYLFHNPWKTSYFCSALKWKLWPMMWYTLIKVSLIVNTVFWSFDNNNIYVWIISILEYTYVVCVSCQNSWTQINTSVCTTLRTVFAWQNVPVLSLAASRGLILLH